MTGTTLCLARHEARKRYSHLHILYNKGAKGDITPDKLLIIRALPYTQTHCSYIISSTEAPTDLNPSADASQDHGVAVPRRSTTTLST